MIQLIGALAVVISVLVLAYQGRELAKHTQLANDLAGVETHRELMRHVKSITDVFIRYPELFGHYYGTATAPPNVDEIVRMEMIADQHADLLEAGMVTQRQLPSYATDYFGEWDEYARFVVAQSPVLRARVRANPGVNPPVDAIVAEYDAVVAQDREHTFEMPHS